MPRSKWLPSFTPQHLQQTPSNPLPTLVLEPASANAKKFGLENFGNTCYANSVIQALYFCTPFRDLLLQASDNASQQQDPQPPTPSPPTEPVQPLAPVRRKPERKQSASAVPTIPVPPPPVAAPIPSAPKTLFSALRSLFLYISENPAEKGTVAPRAFIDKLKDLNENFRTTMHQDAHEFLNFLLNRIVEEIEEERKQIQNNTANAGEDMSSSITTLPTAPPTILTASSNSGSTPHDATLVHKLFEGVLTSETRCLSCETVSARDESFLDLSIDIEQNSSLTACLRQFSASEMLSRGNKFSCDSCGGLQEAEKRMKIKKLPNVLALHLKRFKYQEDLQKYIKLTYRVAFPFELRLFNTVDDMDDADRLYNLFAIVVHIGTGPHHGHYISIIKTLGAWLVFDDDNVYPIQESDIPKYFGESNSGSAYVLYYQAVDLDLVSLGLSPAQEEEEAAPALPPGLTVTTNIPALETLAKVAPSTIGASEENSSESELLIPVTSSEPNTTTKPPSIPLQITIADSSSSQNSSTSAPHDTTLTTPLTPSKSKSGLMQKMASISARTVGGNNLSHVNGNGAENRRPIADRTPRPTASSPSLAISESLPVEPPPPLPTTSMQFTKSMGPLENGKEKGSERNLMMEGSVEKEKEKEKDKGDRKSTWFKRKSFRISDKDRARMEENSLPDLATSPGTSHLHSHDSSHSHWFRGKDKHKKQPSEAGLFTEAVLIPQSPARPKSSGTALDENFGPTRHYDELVSSTSASTSSSLHTYSSLPQPSSTASFSSSASSASTVEYPPKRKSSLVAVSEGIAFNPGVVYPLSPLESSSRKSNGPPSASMMIRPATSESSKHLYNGMNRQLPPLPPTPGSPPEEHLPNGQGYGDTHQRAEKTTTLEVPFKPIYSEPLSTPPNLVRSGTYHAPGIITPSISMASTSSNHTEVSSSAATSPPSSSLSSNTMRRATRKLSLTAPMLGFGRRDKDKEKNKDREKEKIQNAFIRS